MHILRVLDPLEGIEKKIAELYERFSEIFGEDAEAASFFYRMSVDEIAHANLVGYQRRVVVQNMKLAKDVSLDLDDINYTLERVKSLLAGPPPSLEEAVKLALEIENSAAEAHSRTAIAEAVPGIYQLLSSLSGFDSKHCEMVENFAASRGFAFVSSQKRSEFMHAARSVPDSESGGTSAAIEPEALERIEHFFEWHKSMDIYEILGVKDYATADEIKRAFHSRAREFHPDSYANAAKELRQKLDVIFSCVTDAYSTLMDPVKRRQYDITHTKLRK